MPELKFEEALKKLEAIVEGLEQGKISLEDSLKKYEEGIRLAKFCTEKLQEAEKKIEILTRDNSGKFKRGPFKVKEQLTTSGEPAAADNLEEEKQGHQEGFLF